MGRGQPESSMHILYYKFSTPSLTRCPHHCFPALVTSRAVGQGEEKQNSKSWYGSKSRYSYTDKRSGTERHRKWQEGNGFPCFDEWTVRFGKERVGELETFRKPRFVHERNISLLGEVIHFDNDNFSDGLNPPTRSFAFWCMKVPYKFPETIFVAFNIILRETIIFEMCPMGSHEQNRS